MRLAGRILVVDPHARFRALVLAKLRRRGIACDGLGDAGQAAAVLRRGEHDVLVVDVGSAGRRQLLLAIHAEPLVLAVVAVAGRPTVAGALAALRVRAVDYLTKPIRLTVLVQSIQLALQTAAAVRGVRRAERLITLWAEWTRLLDTTLSGPAGASLPPRLLHAVARDRTGSDDEPSPLGGAALSPREHQVLLAFASGLRVRQLARTLGVSVHTARAHLKSIMRKLNVHSQSALLDRLYAAGRDDASRQEDPDAHR